MQLPTLDGSIQQRIQRAVLEQLPGAEVEVTGGGGHFSLKVVSAEFAGKNTLAKQRLVLRALAPLMSGPNAPVHAIDSLQTLTPE